MPDSHKPASQNLSVPNRSAAIPFGEASQPGDRPEQSPGLRPVLGPGLVMLYGVGGMLGAGIYVLIPNVAKTLGNAVWLAFVISMIAALLTGLSYACIGSRYPKAAGAAYATLRAYRFRGLAYVVGLAVTASGLTSMATGARAIGAEIQKMGATLPPTVMSVIYLVLLAGIVFWGIRQCMAMNVVCTTVEVLGLLFIIVIGIGYVGSADLLRGPPIVTSAASIESATSIAGPSTDADAFGSLTLAIVMSGAVLTFFAFIGFEDILNIAEETKNPRRDIPFGLIGAMMIATVIYMLVAVIAVSAVPFEMLQKEGLRGVVKVAAPWCPPWVFSVVLIFAVANTALLNYVMASRLVYGMSKSGLLPRALSKVNAKTRTPWMATLVLLGLIVVLVLIGRISDLAAATTLLLLSVFAVVNVGLVMLKLRRDEPRGGFEVPAIVPALGAIVCAALVVVRIVNPPGGNQMAAIIAGSVLAMAVLLFYALRPREVIAEEST
jgi:amino acid transporter